jgi:hypothetical protein
VVAASSRSIAARLSASILVDGGFDVFWLNGGVGGQIGGGEQRVGHRWEVSGWEFRWTKNALEYSRSTRFGGKVRNLENYRIKPDEIRVPLLPVTFPEAGPSMTR